MLNLLISLLFVHSVISFPYIVAEVNGPRSINDFNYIVFEQDLTWPEAKQFCESRGGHLVTITSSEEQSLVHTLLQEGPFPLGAWIGLSDETIEGTWQWVTGEELTYTNWVSGEPYGVDYAMMHDGSGQWDGPFESPTLPFVCEWSDSQSSNLDLNRDPLVVVRILLFLFIIGTILGITHYKRKLT